MKLYLISQTDNRGYDTYDSAVVVADNKEEAQKMYPASGTDITTIEKGLKGDYISHLWDWVDDPSLVSVELLGEAKIDLPKGVVCASYNAG